MRVNYLGLEAFLAVAEIGSFGRAAARLNISQTALSHRLRKIEEELGTRLVARTSRSVSLTTAGEALLPEVQRRLKDLGALMETLQGTGRAAQARLSFACLPTVAQYHLPAALARLAAEMPAVEVALRDQPAADIIDLVRAGEVEFGVTILGTGHWDLEAEPLAVEPYCLLVGRGHRLAGRESVQLADLAGETMVRIRTHSTNRELVEAALGPMRDRIAWRYEVRSAATAVALVAAGVAVTVLPRMTAEMGAPGVVGLPFADISASRQIGLVRRRGEPPGAAARCLIGHLRGLMQGGG